jgi:hypothetical protein
VVGDCLSVVGALFVSNPVPATACERVKELRQIEWAMAVYVEEAKPDVVAEQPIEIVVGYPVVFAPAPSVFECDNRLRLLEGSNGAFKGEWFGAFYVNFMKSGNHPSGRWSSRRSIATVMVSVLAGRR